MAAIEVYKIANGRKQVNVNLVALPVTELRDVDETNRD